MLMPQRMARWPGGVRPGNTESGLKSVPFPAIARAIPFGLLACAAVTLDAIAEISNAFLNMLGSHPVWLMLVAPVAGVVAEVVAGVAGRTIRIVVAIEQKELVVVKRGRFPVLGGVALSAVALDLSVQAVAR